MDEVNKKEIIIHKVGRVLADNLKGFFGSIRFNIRDGNYENVNIEQSLKPEIQEKKTE